jgi:DNA modification methylase
MKRERSLFPELTWPDKRVAGAAGPLSTSGPPPALQVVEVVGDPGSVGGGSAGGAGAHPRPGAVPPQSKLVRGDNRAVMRALHGSLAGRVDLVYMDPPFGTGESFALTERAGGEHQVVPAYSDRWSPGLGAYLSTMLEQLTLTRALLSDRGTLFLHCDWRVSHYLRCLLDEVFGPECFKNEIVWRYRRWPAKTRVFQRMHDVVFWYGKTPDDRHAWTPLFEPLAKSTLETWGTKRQIADFSTGRRKPSQTDEETPGAPMSDVWDIGIIAPIARERVGYPTQKPEALLRRIIEATTRPGDLVADFFAGSGTTLVAAEKLGRRWIGCDQSRAAVHLARKRLVALPSASFALLAPAGDPLADGEGPAVEVSAVGAAAGRAVRLTLHGHGTSAVDSWSVDWDHDGHVFHHAFGVQRPHARAKIPLSTEHTYPAPGPRRIAVQIVGAGGQERREVIAWNA